MGAGPEGLEAEPRKPSLRADSVAGSLRLRVPTDDRLSEPHQTQEIQLQEVNQVERSTGGQD